MLFAAKIHRASQLLATPELLLQLPNPLFDEVQPPELSATGCLAYAIVGITFIFINIAIVRKTAPRDAWSPRQLYVKRQVLVFLAVVLARWAMYAAARHLSFSAWLLCLPLNVFETWCAQRNADLYEGRPALLVSRRLVSLCAKVTLAEIVAVTFLHRIQEPWVRTAGPAGAPLARAALGGCLLFDVGVDLAFYTLHRACHENRRLYKWVHRDHHTRTGHEGGAEKETRLVAWDTYEISWAEMTLIEVGYGLGFGLVIWTYGHDFSLFDLAIMLTWAHLVELLGHTSMSWTWEGNPLRLLQETMGLDLKVADHRYASHVHPFTEGTSCNIV
jgi:hypothetical protein